MDRLPHREVVDAWAEVGKQGNAAILDRVASSRSAHLSPLQAHARTAPSLRDVVEGLVASWRMVTSAWPLTFDAAEPSVVLCGPDSPTQAESALMLYLVADIVQTGRQITGGRWRPVDVQLGFAWSDTSWWTQHLGAPVHDRAPRTAVRLRHTDLAVRPSHADPLVAEAVSAHISTLVEPLTHHPTLTATVRAWLSAQVAGPHPAFPTAAEAARHLGRSVRTLTRHLAMEHTTFRAIADEVRLGLAERWLATRTVAQVAERLGYANEGGFRRAFRRWTGRAPRDAPLSSPDPPAPRRR